MIIEQLQQFPKQLGFSPCSIDLLNILCEMKQFQKIWLLFRKKNIRICSTFWLKCPKDELSRTKTEQAEFVSLTSFTSTLAPALLATKIYICAVAC